MPAWFLMCPANTQASRSSCVTQPVVAASSGSGGEVRQGKSRAAMFKLVYPRYDPVKLHDWFNLFVIGLLNIENVFYLATGQVSIAPPCVQQGSVHQNLAVVCWSGCGSRAS